MMKEILYKGKTLMTAILVVMGATSCQYKDFESEGGTELLPVIVDFDWAKVDSVPHAMRVAFYSQDKIDNSKNYIFFDLPKSIWPARGKLPGGFYNVVAWNNDTEHVLTDDYNMQNKLYATTPQYNTKENVEIPTVLDSIYNGQQVLYCPDYMVHSYNTPISVLEKNKRITLVPDSMIITVDYKINGIRGLSWVKQVRGAINNVAAKRYINIQNKTENAVAVMFDCKYNQVDNAIYGSFYVFGVNPTDQNNLPHKIVLFFWTDSGKVYLPIDVTDIFAKYKQGNPKIYIEIPSLDIDIRDYISSKNTFDINLEEWENINIDVGF